MNNVTVVSAFVDLNVLHMKKEQYIELGDKMFVAAHRVGAEIYVATPPLTGCWSFDLCYGRKPATETPADRYATPEDHVASHIVQHTRTQWALEATKNTVPDVVVWLDLGILKQGQHTGKLITPDDVSWFVEAVQMYPFDDIPFPGITGPDPWLPHGNNWRFCGSTHIWPVKWLDQIHRSYQHCLRRFVHEYDCVPLDLAIWPLVERGSGLPFKWYQAEYDNTQLRNFPCPL
jgi:hypothetical protein